MQLTPGAEAYLVTADVASFYTSILVESAMAAVDACLQRTTDWSDRWIGELLRGLELVLGLNFLQCDGEVYKQEHGLAMGTACAPPVAQIFMHGLERSLHAALAPVVSMHSIRVRATQQGVACTGGWLRLVRLASTVVVTVDC